MGLRRMVEFDTGEFIGEKWKSTFVAVSLHVK